MGGESTNDAAFPVRAHPRDLLRFSFMHRDAMMVKPRSLYDVSYAGALQSRVATASGASPGPGAPTKTQSVRQKMLLQSMIPPFVVEGANKATPPSLYRESFADDGKRAHAASYPSAGKPLPRDDIAKAPRETTETSLSRASYVSHESDVYRQRHRAVVAHREAVAKRYEEAVIEFRRQATTSSDPRCRLRSLQQDSYQRPKRLEDGQCRTKQDQNITSSEHARDYRMGCTSTHRGDYCAVPRVSLTTYPRQQHDCSTPCVTLHEELFANPVAPLLLVHHSKDLERAAATGGRSSADAVSAALSTMSTEVADTISFRAQSSCEVIPQKRPFPGLTVHVPVSQCTGEGVFEKRVLDSRRPQHLDRASTRPSSHTPTQIFYEGHKEPYRSLSRVDYRPFQFAGRGEPGIHRGL